MFKRAIVARYLVSNGLNNPHNAYLKKDIFDLAYVTKAAKSKQMPEKGYVKSQGIQKGTLDWKKAKLGLIWRQIQNWFLHAEIFLRSYDVTRRIEGYYTPSDVIAAGEFYFLFILILSM